MLSIKACLYFILFNMVESIMLKNKLGFRFLEGNSWVYNAGDLEILIDPVLEKSLDFGIPFLYSGNKRIIDQKVELSNLSKSSDYVLITQGFDDHAHIPTLKRLFSLNPKMKYIAPPSAKSILLNCKISESCISIITHGETITVNKKQTSIEITATTGALLGPPWQTKENGYIIKPSKSSVIKFPSLYYEPHCMYDSNELSNYSVDCIISPVVAQELPNFTLVAGGQKSIDLAKLLKASTIVPLNNGELDQSGVLADLVRCDGTINDFKKLAQSNKIDFRDVKPGEKIFI